MKIIVIHCPPWKIPSGLWDVESYSEYGPPTKTYANLKQEHIRQKIEGDYTTPPYGLLSIASLAKSKGYEVITLNLSNFPWSKIKKIISAINNADIFGMSCVTINRRGVAAMAKLIKKLHPQSKVIIGGAHASAVPKKMLEYHQDIDVVVIGEGEDTFLDIVSNVEKGNSLEGIPGTAWRTASTIEVGPTRKPIYNIDKLVSPVEYFPIRIILTSRGCPGKCTYCASNALWGKRLTLNSAEYVLNVLDKAVNKHGQKFLSIKDDTFTTSRSRVLEICNGIIERKLNFVWSCDTRVDCLDEDILSIMRKAGCQRISLGVESGSPKILENIKKNITPKQIIEATTLAKKYGFQIRFYMMFGNLGETKETVKQSLELIMKCKPNAYLFSPLAIYPGTEVFNHYCKKLGGNEDIFFTNDIEEIWVFLGKKKDGEFIKKWYISDYYSKGALFWDYNVNERLAILNRLPDLSHAYLDVGGAFYKKGDLENAESYLQLALEKDYPLPGFIYNYFACIAAVRGDYLGAKIHLEKAISFYPHYVVQENLKTIKKWLHEAGKSSKQMPNLLAQHYFEDEIETGQPIKPLPIDWDNL